MNTVKEQLIGIIKIVCEGQELPLDAIDQIDESTHLRDHLQLDSLDLAEMSVRIEEAFEIDIYAEGLVNTVGDVINKISA